MEELITLEIEESKRAFLLELLGNFDFVEVQDNCIWKELFDIEKMIDMKKEETKPKRFTDFTFKQVLDNFNLESQRIELFTDTKPQAANEWLDRAIKIANNKILRSEKERSESIIAPILTDLEARHDFNFRIFSGEFIDIDADKGLKGEFDFAFVNDAEATELVAPIFTLVEAKQGDITKHWGQIAAQMVGAREENKNRKEDVKAIFGCITSGELWRFMKLENDCIYIDDRTYYLNELEKILGIFQYIVDFYRK